MQKNLLVLVAEKNEKLILSLQMFVDKKGIGHGIPPNAREPEARLVNFFGAFVTIF